MPVPRLRHVPGLCCLAAAVSLLSFAAPGAGQKPAPAKPRPAEEKEESCWKARYGKCDGVERSADIVFVYPRGLFRRDPAQVVKRLQAGWDLLRTATEIDPTRAFGQRVVVGFRHPSDEGGKDCAPGWSRESGTPHGFRGERWPFINIPWGYLGRGDQPEECCTHEMVHAFIAARPLRDNRKEWVEGMCDFLRLPVFEAVGMPAVRDERYRLYRASAWQPGVNYYHDYAGRLIRWCERRHLDVRKKDQLAKVVPTLWNLDLTADLGQPPR